MPSKSPNSEFWKTLRRLKPEKRKTKLEPRPASALPWLGAAQAHDTKLLYDTTVYVDILQGRFPSNNELDLRIADAWHSTVTESELSAACGLLNPLHPGTRAAMEGISEVIDRRPSHRTIAPDREIWQAAGIMAGLLARLQQYAAADRRRILNDALLLATARKHGLTVLTRNVADFDFLQQLDPAAKVLFYRV